jgi:hypothetical protein
MRHDQGQLPMANHICEVQDCPISCARCYQKHRKQHHISSWRLWILRVKKELPSIRSTAWPFPRHSDIQPLWPFGGFLLIDTMVCCHNVEHGLKAWNCWAVGLVERECVCHILSGKLGRRLERRLDAFEVTCVSAIFWGVKACCCRQLIVCIDEEERCLATEIIQRLYLLEAWNEILRKPLIISAMHVCLQVFWHKEGYHPRKTAIGRASQQGKVVWIREQVRSVFIYWSISSEAHWLPITIRIGLREWRSPLSWLRQHTLWARSSESLCPKGISS